MKKILCTLGPTSFNEKTIVRLEELGVSLFRINLSHTPLEKVAETIDLIRRYSKNVPVCLDTEGAQIRTGCLGVKEKQLEENQVLNITNAVRATSEDELPLYPDFVPGILREGDLLSIDFDSAMIQIISVDGENVKARVISAGVVGNNKAVSSLRDIDLYPFTDKDVAAIKIGNKMGIRHYALSFASTRKDVETMKKLTKNAHIISKIESRKGYEHLDEILKATDEILVDRGDLSREISIELVPFYQAKIIKMANKAKKPVVIATNLLESMIEKANPTRAEVNDVVGALIMGADGLVLAAETAIGKHPIAAASMISKLINQYYISLNEDITNNQTHASSALVAPHGGALVDRRDRKPNFKKVAKLKSITIDDSVIMDCEQIAIGTYSPLDGFMGRDCLHSVLEHYKLLNGVVWTLPIVLQQHATSIKGVRRGQTIALKNAKDKRIYATLTVEDIYKFPYQQVCQKWFGTLDETHPGVKKLKYGGDCFIGGKITLLRRRECPHRIYSFTPEELRHIFDSRGWSRVVGFHTRNVVHRGHEAIQKMALEKTHCDGLLISPVIGEKKKGDFVSKMLLKSYQLMVDNGFLPKEKTFIGALSTYSRYSGAREAVFTALCRKNFGCSHFIIGRDHTGVGNFYTPTASQELFSQLGDIGIKPVFFDEVVYCNGCNDYVFQCDCSGSELLKISGTKVRDSLAMGEKPPLWMMRNEVSQMVVDHVNNHEEIFV